MAMAIYELRTYALRVGVLNEAIGYYNELGWPALKKGGFDKKLIGYFIADTGTINSLIRHSPDDIQIRGRRTTDPPPWELRTLRSPPMRRLWRADQVRNAIWQSIPPSRRTSPIVFTSPLISSAYAGTGLGRRSSIKLKIFWNKLLGTATSANWNVTYRP